ncbi:hypothetical protein AVEN_74289-1 [Araneus ventricosus]|uniref:Uncharacterized protein n=1 Tax=Araneus ventricosus TaxID=182803 RepID=A0A4Y2RUM2_ARAVE|nr:hypothetical protein AVEN_74289-1 [Araneus ventricosus]
MSVNARTSKEVRRHTSPYYSSSIVYASWNGAASRIPNGKKSPIPEQLVGNADNLYFVLDGGSLIHRVVWPKQETFDDVYTTYMSYIKRHYGDEVTVVSDG